MVDKKLFIPDKDKSAEEMIERCIDNDFREIKFSHDLNGYPDRIEITLLRIQYIQIILDST